MDSAGSDTVAIPDPAPGQFTWWVIVGAESTRESLHGYSSEGSLRPAAGTGHCGISEQSAATNCSSCGNGIAEGAEICDGSDLAGQTCKSQGFHSGALGCAPGCDGFDSSACAVCGDGVREADEGCDGSDFGGETCESLGYSGGDLMCDEDCSEFFITLSCD